MAALYNRVKVNTATTGTGTVTLGSASSNAFCTFAEAGVPNATSVTYVIEEGTDFEIGRGTYTSSGTTLSRDTVLLSKISGTSGTTKMTLAGAATVRIDVAAEDLNNGKITSGQIPGTTTNDNASSGNHGEVVETLVNNGAGLISLTTATPKTIATVSLTAGDWDVWWSPHLVGQANTTTYTYMAWSISTVTDSHTVTSYSTGYQQKSLGGVSYPQALQKPGITGPLRVSVSSTTTMYGVVEVSFGGGTCSACGHMYARRVR